MCSVIEAIRFRDRNWMMEVVGSLGLTESIKGKKTNLLVCVLWLVGYGMSFHC